MAGWFVYLVECADTTLYCGVTTNPERRIAQHNGLHPGGARYTRVRRPVKLLACRACPDRKTAQQWEYRIKHAPRTAKLNLLTASTAQDSSDALLESPHD